MNSFPILTTIIFLLVSTLGQAQNKYAVVKKIGADSIKRAGILLDNGEILIPLKYKYIFKTDSLFFVNNFEKWGWLDLNGKNIVDPRYSDVGYGLSENLIRVKKDDKWGFVSINGSVTIKLQYDFACNFKNGLAYVRQDSVQGFISTDGSFIKTPNIDQDYCPEDDGEIDDIPNGFETSTNLMVKESLEKFGVVSKSSKILIPIVYDEIKYYINGIIQVKKNNKYGAYKDNGELISDPIYDEMWFFNDL
jgi:hypothetical protein